MHRTKNSGITSEITFHWEWTATTGKEKIEFMQDKKNGKKKRPTKLSQTRKEGRPWVRSQFIIGWLICDMKWFINYSGNHERLENGLHFPSVD
jgi:hypothetical protein